MINLEKMSADIIEKLYNGQEAEEKMKLKMAYGLSVFLGLFIELSLCIMISILIQTTRFLIPLMGSALLLRMFTGGKHCTSYDRCLIFTTVYFLPLSWVVKYTYYLNGVLLFYCSAALLAITAIQAKKRLRDKHFIFLMGTVVLLFAGSFFDWLQWLILSFSFGLAAQALMLSAPGAHVISFFDRYLKEIGI